MILSTGGSGIVKAAYSSGKPACRGHRQSRRGQVLRLRRRLLRRAGHRQLDFPYVPAAKLPSHCGTINFVEKKADVSTMQDFSAEAAADIVALHTAWIECELRGKVDELLKFCADDIEFWPPNAQPVRGKRAVTAYLSAPASKPVRIEISDRQIHGSATLAYLTASFRTTPAAPVDPGAEVIGHHLWILRKAAADWRIVLVSWSIAETRPASATAPISGL